MALSEAAIKLTEYQKRWIADKSRFKLGLWSRQSGKSFASSLEAVLDCLERKTRWVFLSAGERQSKELCEAAAMHSRAAGRAVEILEDGFKEGDTEYKKLEINFPNKSRIVALPANPMTARGHSANILLDEFAFHRDSRAIWRALFPTITRGYKMRIVSTPQGRKNKFYELWSADNRYSKYKITIYDAVEQGLELRDEEGNPCTSEDLRVALGDEEAWAQEYECEFLDEASAFLTYDLIAECEDQQLVAQPAWVEQLLAAAEESYKQYRREKAAREVPIDPSVFERVVFLGELYLGMDIGRKRDMSVIWLDQKIGNILHTAAVIELKKAPFQLQKQVVFALLGRPELRRACIDETGIGMQLAEQAVERFGGYKVEAITFSAANKEVLADGLKRCFEDRGCRIPVAQHIRSSLHSVKRYTTATGHFRFDADRTEETGHADHFWAKALAVQAAENKKPWVLEYEGVGQRVGVAGFGERLRGGALAGMVNF
jgi:phage FluMu gp28-like protein